MHKIGSACSLLFTYAALPKCYGNTHCGSKFSSRNISKCKLFYVSYQRQKATLQELKSKQNSGNYFEIVDKPYFTACKADLADFLNL